MRFHISRQTKRRLANRFGYNVFLRLLLFKFWFRMAFLGFVLLLGLLLLFLPKIWTATPRGFRPTVKISGLDKVQAWSLKRTARRETLSGNFERAHYAWRAAVANNAADASAVRGLIYNLAHWPASPPEVEQAGLKLSSWLLRLTGMNRADVGLVAQFYSAHAYQESVIGLLWPLQNLGPAEQALLLKALFHRGRMVDFNARWKLFGAQKLSDSELPLYRAAFDAGWGPVEEAAAGRQRLKAASADPAEQNLANRLRLVVSSRLNDVPGYEEALTRLQEWGEASVVDHTRYWILLTRANRKDEARQLATNYAGQARTPDEYITLARTYLELGLSEQAHNCFRALISVHPQAEQGWLAYASFLTESQRWEDLARLSVQIRTEARLEQKLLGFSYYLEGWAEHELNRRLPTEEAFRKMAQVWVGHAALVAPAAGNLIRMGYARIAVQLLARFEDELRAQPAFWEAQFNAASDLKDPALLLKAAQNEFGLDPRNPETENRFAAALLINRQQPDLAARLTLKLMSTYPNSVAARVNHGFALLLNHRTQDALALLSKIQRQSLSPEQSSSLAWALFQVHFELGEYQKAWEMLDGINSKLLFPTDVAWLEDCRAKMPPRSAAK